MLVVDAAASQDWTCRNLETFYKYAAIQIAKFLETRDRNQSLPPSKTGRRVGSRLGMIGHEAC